MRTQRSCSWYVVIFAILAGVGAAAPARPTAQKGEPFTVHPGLVYSAVDRKLALDLYLPEPSFARPVPAVLVIQGGGFLAQDGRKFRPFAAYLARHGFAAALIAYRGRPDHRYQDTVADTKAAIRFVRKVAAQYAIDPNRIGAMGRSAGGTLAALLAVTGGESAWEGQGGHPEFSSRIQAAVAISGVFDFVARFTEERQIALQPAVKAKAETNGQWLGSPFSSRDEHWLRASAVNHVDRGDPPVLFLHCQDDATVPWLQSQAMVEKMQATGIKSEVVYYPTGGHGYKGRDAEAMAEMVRFFRQAL